MPVEILECLGLRPGLKKNHFIEATNRTNLKFLGLNLKSKTYDQLRVDI